MNNQTYVDNTISLYSKTGWKKWFSKVRFWDAPFIEVERLIPKKGLIVDLGCGEGIFTNYLALTSPTRKIIGIEIDRKRIKEANHKLQNVTFKQGNATEAKIPECSAVVMFHLLHHLKSYKLQENIIKKSLKALDKGGKLVIVEIDKKPFWKYLVSWLTDHFVVAWLFERKFYEKDIFFRSRSSWAKFFEKNNKSLKTIEAHRNKPFSHIILISQ